MQSSQSLTYRFPIQDEQGWKAHLNKHGFVVVSGLIDESLCQSVIHDMRETLTKLSPALKLDDDKTWASPDNYPFMLHGGMVQYVGHAKFQWTLREKATEVFSKVWDVKPTELATSFDGFCYMDGRRGYDPSSLILNAHSDQSPTRDYLWSVQGLFNLCNNCIEDGGLVIIPDTHTIHQEFFKKIGQENFPNDWYLFSEEEKQDPVFKTAIKICGKAGDFMMWDSRTFHCNTKPSSQNVRACVYVCQVPKKNVPEDTIKERKFAWENKRCSSHQPGDGFRCFPQIPKHAVPKYVDIIPTVSIREEELTELQKSLLYTRS